MCNKQLSNKYKLKHHMNVHSDKKNFKCGICDTYFKAKDSLTRHVERFHKNHDGQLDQQRKKEAAETKQEDDQGKDLTGRNRIIAFSEF